MTPFLRQVAEVYYNRLGNRIADCCFVFPNRRAGLFFQHYLSEITTHPILSPEITSISDFFTKFSPLNLTDRISLLFYLYKAYKEVFGKEESFDEFVSWGDMILNDFNDIDKHLADAKKIYSLILDEKKIEQEFDYLTPEQREILHKFWKGFILSKDKPYRKKFIKMWELLYPLYERFREILLEDNRAYEGMLVRSVAENNRMDWSKVPFERAVFVGLNALTKSERQLMLSLGREGKADFYWDTRSPKIQDTRNRASLFILRNQKMFPSLYKLEQEELEEPEVTLIGVPSLNGQVKQIYPILQKLFTGIAGKALQTAVVLPDEQLLLPLLHSIPPCYEDINITMGYPLKNTQTIVLINYLMELQQLKRNIEGEQKFYFQPVLKLLSHPYLHLLCHEEIEKILREIKKKNHFFLSPKELSIHTALRKVFLPLEENENPAEYLIAIIEEIVSTFLHTASSQETENQPPMQGKEIEMESLHSSLLLLRHIKDLGEQFSFEMRTNTWFSLIKRLFSSESISYEGEPLDGLQIMGILETRSLDFENLIIPSMNEGLFPSKSFSNSFIPNNLREAWELPTYKYQDSVWTYHFYRLISRAKHIFLLYNTSIGSTKGSEVSRFVQQLRYLYKVPIREERPSFPTLLKEESPLLVQKDEEVMKLLKPFLTPGSKKGISATAINDYLDCPLRFYLSYVLEIKEDKEIEEIIEEDIFGTIFHKVMEEIYGLMKKKAHSDSRAVITKEEKKPMAAI